MIPSNNNNTLYLVTGVAGNLGSSVASQLIEQSFQERRLVPKGAPALAATKAVKEIGGKTI